MCAKILPKPASEYPAVSTPSTGALTKHYETALLREHVVCPVLQTNFATVCGSLIYASPCCRPDIAITVGLLARCLTFPTPELMEDAVRCAVYLGQHPDDGIVFDAKAPGGEIMWSESDSDWALAHSTSGWHVSLAGGLVGYGAKRQHCIALSSTEAEIMAASQLATELVYFRGLLREARMPQLAPTDIGCDNDGARELSIDRKSCVRSRHLARRVFKVRELTVTGDVRVVRVATADNRADLFTKPLLPATFLRHKAVLMGAAAGAMSLANASLQRGKSILRQEQPDDLTLPPGAERRITFASSVDAGRPGTTATAKRARRVRRASML